MQLGTNESLVSACLRALRQHSFYAAYEKAFEVVTADTDALRDAAFRLRYQVYCVENRFLPQNAAERERDAYDDQAVHHLLIQRATSDVVGACRVVLPQAERPLLSFELLRHCNHPLLHIENRILGMCEISRLCMPANFRRRLLDGALLPAWSQPEDGDSDGAGRPLFRRRIPYAPLGLLQAAFATAFEQGLPDVLMSVEIAQLKTFKKVGLTGRLLGSAIDLHGGQQPMLFNIKSILDNVAVINPPCWDVITNHGRLGYGVEHSAS